MAVENKLRAENNDSNTGKKVIDLKQVRKSG